MRTKVLIASIGTHWPRFRYEIRILLRKSRKLHDLIFIYVESIRYYIGSYKNLRIKIKNEKS